MANDPNQEFLVPASNISSPISSVSTPPSHAVKDQIFRKVPTDEIMDKLLSSFGLKDIDDQKTFSRNDLRTIKTVEKLNLLKPELEVFYIPCKARTYLSYIDEKTAITILRQFVKTRNRMIESREKYMKGYKFLIYYIVKTYNRPYKPIAWRENSSDNLSDSEEKNKPVTLHFD
jgi:hypothetical protein